MGSEAEELRENAKRCRRLAKAVIDERNLRLLLELAERLEEQAEKLERGSDRPGIAVRRIGPGT